MCESTIFANKYISLSLKFTALLAKPFVLCSSRKITYSRLWKCENNT